MVILYVHVSAHFQWMQCVMMVIIVKGVPLAVHALAKVARDYAHVYCQWMQTFLAEVGTHC